MYSPQGVEDFSSLPAPSPGPQKLRYTHDAMIDALIANPGISQGALASYFGYTQSWVSLIMSSDSFQERMSERRDDLVDPAIRASIEERFRALTSRSLQVLQDKLSQPSNAISDQLALKALELGAKGLGVGAPPPPPVNSEDRLDRLALRLIALQTGIRGQDLGQASQGQNFHPPIPGESREIIS